MGLYVIKIPNKSTSQSSYFTQIFKKHNSTVLTFTENEGNLPADENQISVYMNGNFMNPSDWSVSGSDIILTFTPFNADFIVKVIYP